MTFKNHRNITLMSESNHYQHESPTSNIVYKILSWNQLTCCIWANLIQSKEMVLENRLLLVHFWQIQHVVPDSVEILLVIPIYSTKNPKLFPVICLFLCGCLRKYTCLTVCWTSFCCLFLCLKCFWRWLWCSLLFIDGTDFIFVLDLNQF